VNTDEQKRAAAEAALSHVNSGMKLGLGTGSTAKYFVEGVAGLVKKGWQLECVPTSETTRSQAESLGIRITTLDQAPHLDLTVDGADELDGELNLIKGGGGALLREKIVATSSRKMIVIADASKRVSRLGAFPLPVEIVPFGIKATSWKIDSAFRQLGLKGPMAARVKDGKPFVTDNGNVIIDCKLSEIPDPRRLAAILSGIPGVVDHGLFVGIASLAIIAGPDGINTISR
jgi:ribose 5-phosphate isomerase A